MIFSINFLILFLSLEYRYQPQQQEFQNYQQMLADQQQAVAQRMQQFYDANSGIRYNIVVPSNLTANQKILYEEQLRRGIVDRLGSANSVQQPGATASVYRPPEAEYRPRPGPYRPRLPQSMPQSVSFEPGLPQSHYHHFKLPSIGQQQTRPQQQQGNSGAPPIVRIVAASNSSSNTARVIPASRNLEIERYKLAQQQLKQQLPQQQQQKSKNLPNGSQM